VNASSSADAEALLRRVRTVLLDSTAGVFDLRRLPRPGRDGDLAATAAAAGHPVPGEYLRNQDPLDIFRFAGTIGPDLTALIECELTAAELKAAETAEPTPGAGYRQVVLVTRRDLHRRADRLRGREGEAIFAEAVEVESDGVAHLAFGLLDRVAQGDAAGQVGSPGAEVVVGGGADEDHVRGGVAHGYSVIKVRPSWSAKSM
jgi:hypothetical protein